MVGGRSTFAGWHVATGTGYLVGLFFSLGIGAFVGLKTGRLVGLNIFIGLRVLQTGLLVGQCVGGGQ